MSSMKMTFFSHMRNPGGGRKRKFQRMQRAGHGSKLHGIGDDGDGAMRGRYSVVWEVLELKLEEGLGRKSLVLFSGPWICEKA